MTRRLLLCVAAVLVWVASGPGSAGAGTAPSALQFVQLAPNGAPGVVNSLALGELPDGQPIAVTPFADDELSLSVKTRFEEALRAAGRPVAESALLTLSFESKIIEGRFTQAEANMGRFEADDEGVALNLNIWSSSRDSLLGGRQKADGSSRKVNLMHMNAVLRDRESGKILWQGDAYCEMLTADQARIAGSMVAPLTASLGRSVTGQPFDIE
jgi:hypothetical protein